MTECVIQPHRPHPANDGLLLCRGHFAKLGQALADLEDETALLSAVPSMQQRTGRTGGLASHRSPARLDVLVHLDHRRGTGKSEDDDDALAAGDTLPVYDVLASWARLVREERNLIQPQHVTISGERDALSRHLEWIAAQPWIDELYTEVTRLLAQLRSANGTAPPKPVGRCYLIDEDEQCGGPIWVDDSLGHAYCGKCRSTWDGPQLTLLHASIEADRREAARPHTTDGRPMLTAHELVRDGIVSTVGNVRVIAHRRRIVSVEGHYDPAAFGRAEVAS